MLMITTEMKTLYLILFMPEVEPNPFAMNPRAITKDLAPQGAENENDENDVKIEEQQQPCQDEGENQGAPEEF